jgi:hypothetical protein
MAKIWQKKPFLGAGAADLCSRAAVKGWFKIFLLIYCEIHMGMGWILA